ncbi:CRISPR-associated Cas5e family protein [Rippkaea orientalis PCC 8801]|uniref:CRISPR-associated Cas5e family protein n=1 Tax=Rippkaea orientalis (strain PCC 8801 / RF-1) TaxID=41431 RepID=B7JVM6_RIPO1|nr:CRISPR system precrRNA processing endoribonuclease RAMP protein Cas6 [Rippkaea orientalis]ACK64597.1 CRISPR-associated Cas5e family protein [Rippkaea orientalis PCC 8801]
MVQDILPQLHKYQLQSLVIELGVAKQGKLPATLSRAIHACVLNWLSLADSQLANQIHDSQISPLCLSGLIGNRRQPYSLLGDYFLLRIGVLQPSLIKPLLKGIEAQETQTLELGKFPFIIRQVYSMPQSHKLSQLTDYYSLALYSPTMTEIQLKFLSPTSFKQIQGVQPFPLPELVFNSLLRKWNHFAPQELKFPEIQWQSFVSAFELKTHALKMEGGAEIGSQGWVKYCFKDTEQARIASILSHFAFYAGVGRKTTMGMGQTQLLVNT